MPNKSTTALVAIAIIIVAAFSAYAWVTYPRTVVNIQESFTIGVDSKTTAFNQPYLDDKAQVKVTIQNGEQPYGELKSEVVIKLSGNIWQHKGNSKATAAIGFKCPAEVTILLSE